MESTKASLQDKKLVRHVSPLGMRVLVKIIAKDDITAGGLYIPENAKNRMSESLLAEVLEVASAVDDSTNEETNISGIPMGTTVLIHKTVGTTVPWDDTLRIVDTKDVLALVEELSIT